jgi:hypothetical protein
MEGYFPRMRRTCFEALAMTASLALAACAAGSVATELSEPGVGVSADAGDTTQSQGGQEDSGGSTTTTPPSSGEDAGGAQAPSEDSGQAGLDDSGDPTSGEDSGGAGEDSGVGGEDSGGGGGEDSGGGVGPTDCPQTAANLLAWGVLQLAGAGTSCSSSPAACSASDCCYVPSTAPDEALCLP